MRLRTANRADRTLGALRWLHPAEGIRVQLCLAAGQQVPAQEATSRVRIGTAARRLYRLRALLDAGEQAARPGLLTARRIRRAERRACGALIRAGFTEPLIAFAVLRQVQVMTQTATLARLDYGTADAAHAAIDGLISSAPAAAPDPGHPVAPAATATEIAGDDRAPSAGRSGPRTGGGLPDRTAMVAEAAAAAGQQDDDPDPGDRDAELVAAARRIVAGTSHVGTRLSQIALAEKLRSEGHKVANNRLRWLAAVSGLEAGQNGEPRANGSR